MRDTDHHIYPCGDHAITVQLGNEIDTAINQKILSLFRYLQTKKINGVKDIIPSYHTLTLVYDIAELKKKDPRETAYANMRRELIEAMNNSAVVADNSSRLVKIPVCYDPSVAPDIVSLAEAHQISVDEVIQLHTAVQYHVYLIGFLPGFAYMGSVDEKIATGRKTQPRTNVPAGSVGIAGRQTGIYPFESPGGWQLIGRTPVSMFDAKKPDPSLLSAGDTVQFSPISIDEFKQLSV